MFKLAVVPAVIFLVSLCGSSVPPLPGSVSGSVYFDANDNGIHDTCDRAQAIPATVEVTNSHGDVERSSVGADGTFVVKSVPAGDNSVRLLSTNGTSLLLTTRTSGGRAGVDVAVKPSEEYSGVEIGVGLLHPNKEGQIVSTGVVFDDKNGNGRIDANECGLPDVTVRTVPYLPTGTFVAPTGNTGGRYEIDSPLAPERLFVILSGGAWVSTTSDDPAAPCTTGVVPTPYMGVAGYYLTNIGFRKAAGSGTLSGTVYDDANDNGQRDTGEQPISGISLRLNTETAACGDLPTQGFVTGSQGDYVLGGLSPGNYLLDLSLQSPDLPYAAWLSRSAPAVVVTVGASAHEDLPIRTAPQGLITVEAFHDRDNDRLRETGEEPATSVQVCLYGQDVPDAASRGSPGSYGPCGVTDAQGTVVLGPVPVGTYAIIDGSGETQGLDFRTNVHLDGPQGASVKLPVLTGVVVPIVATDNQFDKTDIPVTSGTRVTIYLTNKGMAVHNIHVGGLDGGYAGDFCDTSGPDPCSSRLASGQVGTLTFVAPEAGTTLSFRCDYYPGEMHGTISVQPPAP